MTKPWLAVILLTIISGNLGNKCDVNDFNQLTQRVLLLNDALRKVEMTEIGYLLTLLKFYEQLDASGMESEDLSRSQNSVPLWEKIWIDTNHIDGLYRTFEERLDETDKKRSPFDDKQWMDFAKSVLEDSNTSIPSAMDRINDNVQLYFTSHYEVGPGSEFLVELPSIGGVKFEGRGPNIF